MTRMIGLFLTMTLGALGAAAACSSTSSPGPGNTVDSGGGGGGDTGGGNADTAPGATLVGSYDMCTLTPNVVVTMPISTTDNTPIMGGAATITGSGSSLSVTLASEAGFNCTLSLTGSGDTATLAMQTCDTTVTADGITVPVIITFTSGTVTLSGQTLTASAQITVSGVDGGTNVVGSGSISASCTKG
jgi:hypothetical protein